MVRICITAIVMCIAANGIAFGQGFFESVFGPSGLGLTTGNPHSQATLRRFNSPLFYGGSALSRQPNLQQQYGARGNTPGQHPQQPPYYQGQQRGQYHNSRGIHADWATYPRASWNPSAAPVQQPAPQFQQAPRPQHQPSNAQAPLRPGQYSPGQAPDAGVNSMPTGGQQIITTTQNGTTVQYYGPPTGPGQNQAQPPAPAAQPQPQPAPARALPQSRTLGAQQPVRETAPGLIAMPEPTQIPAGRDPRSGWAPAVNRELAGSRAR